jgi:HEAT repeat protein
MWNRVFAWLAVASTLFAACGCGDPTDRLIAQLGDADTSARLAAARTLAENPITDERVLTALATSVSDSDAQVRFFAIKALAKCGPAARASVPALKSALTDSEKQNRIAAAFALLRIEPADRSFEPVLVSAMREGDGKTLLEVGQLGADAAWAVPTLIGLLTHQSPQVRVLAATDLGRIGPAARSAKGALQSALKDSNAAVKHAAKTSLERIESSSPAPPK